jgi:thiol:disulfide interchange protein DsbD
MGNVLLLAALAMLDVIPVRLPTSLVQRAASAGTAGASPGRSAWARCRARGRSLLRPGHGRGADLGLEHPQRGLGFLYLFTFSLGMCALLVVVGLSSGAVARLPRAGMWMVWIKRIFAALMLGAAQYYFVQAGTVWI